jgi:hypothetical protein
MGLTGGTVLIALGVAMILLSMPRRGEAERPFMRNAFAVAFIPTVSLALMTFGVAMVITSF